MLARRLRIVIAARTGNRRTNSEVAPTAARAARWSGAQPAVRRRCRRNTVRSTSVTFSARQNVQCQACREAGVTTKEATHKTHREKFIAEQQACRQCGVYQNQKAFRRVEGGRTDVCRTCEPMPCAACAAMLPQHSFTPQDVSHFLRTIDR